MTVITIAITTIQESAYHSLRSVKYLKKQNKSSSVVEQGMINISEG